jgi:hypothetical protein
MFSLTQNIHYKPQIYFQQQQQTRSPAPDTLNKKTHTGFGAMIDRIHNIRPGCGSCGK